MDHVRLLRGPDHPAAPDPRGHFHQSRAGPCRCDYLWENPTNKGKAGGLWAPLAGTFYLVIGSLLIVTPIGVFAAIYLNEYAKEGWVNRVISITVTSLAGRAEHRPRALWSRALSFS